MLTLTTKLSFALLVSMLGSGCATADVGDKTVAAEQKLEEKESLGIEIIDANFVQEGEQWFVTGQLRARRMLPPSQRRVAIDIVDKSGTVLATKNGVARSYAVTPHVGRNAAAPHGLSLATFKIAIPAPSSFDHADIRIAKEVARS